jgi:hypothetical protein
VITRSRASNGRPRLHYWPSNHPTSIGAYVARPVPRRSAKEYAPFVRHGIADTEPNSRGPRRPALGTALTLIWAAEIVRSESVRAAQFATPRTVVSSLSQGTEEVGRSEELALLGRPPRVAFGCGQGRSAVRGVRAVQALSVPG